MSLRKFAKRYRDAEELATFGINALHRGMGVANRIGALVDAREAGYTKEQILDEVAQIDVEEDDVK